jgi:hypothetical protein
VQGSSNQPWVDNQANWISISTAGFAIRSDGTLWRLSAGTDGVYAVEGLPEDYGPARVGEDSDWASIHGMMLLKQDGSLWSLSKSGDGVNYTAGGGYFGLSSIPRYWHEQRLAGSLNPGRRAFRAVISSPIEAAILIPGHPAFTRRPSLQIVARQIPASRSSYYTPFVLQDDEADTAEVTGSGASLDVVWFGQIPAPSSVGYNSSGIVITNGGSGYTSVPTVEVIPQGDDVNAGLVLTAKLAPVGVSGFTVGSSGSGYTHATAFDSYTGASATAIIQNGAVVGWAVTSSGNAVRQIGDSLSATVTGDGVGASANLILAPSSVIGIKADDSSKNPFCWTTPPLLQIMGGGGTGATAVVNDLHGFISEIKVLNGGSGYTTCRDTGGGFGNNGAYAIGVAAIPDPGDANPNSHKDSSGRWRPIASLSLSGGPVVRVDGPQSGEVLGVNANSGSSGVVRPFTITGFSYWVHSAELVGADGKTVPLTLSKDADAIGYQTYYNTTISLLEEAGGFGCACPIIRVYSRPRTYSSFGWEAVPSQSPPTLKGLEVIAAKPTTICQAGAWQRVAVATFSYYDGPSYWSHQDRYGGTVWNYGQRSPYGYYENGWNELVFVGDAKVTGPRGGESEFYSVDGVLRQKSRTDAVISTSTAPPHNLAVDSPLDAPAEYELFSGRYTYSDYSINHNLNFYTESLFSRWNPESSPEVATLYCVHDDGPRTNVTAVATSNPTTGNISSYPFGLGSGYATATLSNGGSGYKSEPKIYAAVGDTPYPVRIGSDAWKSVGLVDMNSGRYVGVKADGTAHHWGFGDFFKPTPIGRGVVVVANSTTTTTVNGPTWDRLIVDRPTYSSVGCDGGNWYGNTRQGSGRVFKLSSPSGTWGSYNEKTWSNESRSTYGKHEYSAEILYTLPHTLGSGYTSLPNVSYLEVDEENPVLDVSVAFVGPDKFDRVEGCLLIDVEGNAWDVNSSQVFPEPFVVSDVKTVTRNKQDGFGTTAASSFWGGGFGYFTNYTNTTTSFVVNERKKLWPNSVSLLNLGTTVSDGSAIVSYPSGSLLSMEDRTYTATELASVDCSGNKKQTDWSTESGYFIAIDANTQTTVPIKSLADGRLDTASLSSGYSFFLRPSVAPPAITFSAGDCYAVVESVTQPSTMQKYSSSLGIKSATRSAGNSESFSFLWSYFYTVLQDGTVGWKRSHTDYLAVDSTISGIDSVDGWWLHDANSKCLLSLSPVPGRTVPNKPLNVGGNISLVLDSVGSGYNEPPKVYLSQKPNVARAQARLDGKVIGAAVISGGSGFSSPPTISVSSNDGGGSGASLNAIIEGPVDKVTVTSGGSGYRCSPEVIFGLQGVPAEGTASVSGSVSQISVSRGGSRYREAPAISISGAGSGAAAVATISGYVEYVTISDRGAGYTSAPTVSFSGGGGSGATGIAILSRNASGTYSVSEVVVTSGGQGYSSAPSVAFIGGGGSGAAASSTIDAAVTGVTLTQGGSGYTQNTTATAGNGDAILGVSLSMSVNAVDVSYGGEYRSNPSVSFSPFGHIDSISLTGGGSGYKTLPLVGIVGGLGTGATAACTLTGGVQSIAVTNGGSGYLNPPIVELVGGYDPSSGTRASARAVVAGGKVTSIVVDNEGSGYYEQPTVKIGSYKAAIITLAVSNGSITGATVVSGGYGYVNPPEIAVSGGQDAVLSATVSGGVITGVTVVNGGTNYNNSPPVRIIDGIGSGASATAVFSGSVSSVSLTNCGGGYEIGAPVHVIFSGGSGDGASATATIATAGSGASASSRINGSVVHAEVASTGSGYQQSPSVTVDAASSFVVHESATLLSRGEITPESHAEVVRSCTPIVQARILGPVSSITLPDGGNKYGTYDGRFGVCSKPTWATAVGGPLGSPITSLTNPYSASQQFFRQPDVDFGNSYTASCSISARTGAFSVPWDLAPSGREFTSTENSVDRSVDPVAVKTAGSVYAFGDLGSRMHMAGALVVTQYTQSVVPPYSLPPTVIVADVSGGGATGTVSGGSINITSGGSGYTLGAFPWLRGGIPAAWTNPASASASINADGYISSITITNKGSGYVNEGALRYAATVYLDGGGESAGSLQRFGQIYADETTAAWFFTASGVPVEIRKFKTAPRVVIVAHAAPAHRQEVYSYADNKPILLNTSLRRFTRMRITNAKPTRIERQSDRAVSISDLSGLSTVGELWTVFPHYWDGWVDHVWINGVSDQAKIGRFSSPPTVTLFGGGGGTGAACHAEVLKWTDVFCQGAAVRDES